MSQLERWMLDVMRDVTIKNERVQARDGKSYKLRITPYRTLENKIDGVVVTLLDISDLVGPVTKSVGGSRPSTATTPGKSASNRR